MLLHGRVVEIKEWYVNFLRHRLRFIVDINSIAMGGHLQPLIDFQNKIVIHEKIKISHPGIVQHIVPIH